MYSLIMPLPFVEHNFAVSLNVPAVASFHHKYLKLEIVCILGQPVLVFISLLFEPFGT